jgi:hypothetical protein
LSKGIEIYGKETAAKKKKEESINNEGGSVEMSSQLKDLQIEVPD